MRGGKSAGVSKGQLSVGAGLIGIVGGAVNRYGVPAVGAGGGDDMGDSCVGSGSVDRPGGNGARGQVGAVEGGGGRSAGRSDFQGVAVSRSLKSEIRTVWYGADGQFRAGKRQIIGRGTGGGRYVAVGYAR